MTGVVENANAAVLVTVSGDGALLDRRSVVLTSGLPTHPHHHEGSWAMGRYLNTPGARPISLAAAVRLVEQVQVAAVAGARECLAALIEGLPISAIALRVCPELPPTIEERIADSRVQTFADSVMYRRALATAANEKGLHVHWYDRDRVAEQAARVVPGGDLEGVLRLMGRECGPPWQAKHRLAASAALASLRRGPS
jgi:hypothetical protein